MNALGMAINLVGAAQSGAAISANELGSAFSLLTPAQIANLAATKKLDDEMVIAALFASSLSDEQKEAALAAYEAATAKGADAAATNTLTFSMGNLTTALWANIKALGVWLVTNPVGWIMLAVGAIAGAVAGYKQYNKAIEESIQKAQELQDAYKEASAEISGNIATVKDLSSEFNELSKGVGDHGENISLSADEYDRYLDIVDQLVDLNPTLVKGYTAEGNAIIDKNSAIRETISLLREQQALELEEATSDNANWDIAKGLRNAYRKELEDVSTAQSDLIWYLRNSLIEYVDTESVNQLASIFGAQIGELQNWDYGTSYSTEYWNAMFGYLADSAEDAGSIIEENVAYITSLFGAYSTEAIKFQQLLSTWQTAQKTADKAAEAYQSHMKIIAQASIGYNELSDSSKDFVNTWIESQRLTSDMSREQVDDITDKIQNVVGLLSSGIEVDGKDLNSELDKLFKVDWDSIGGEWYNSAREEAEEIIEILAQALDLSDQQVIDLKVALGLVIVDEDGNPVDARTYYIEQLQKRGLLLGADDLSGFTIADLKLLFTVDVDGIDNVDDATNALDAAKKSANELEDSIIDLESALSNFDDATGKLEKLYSAMSSLDELNGAPIPIDLLNEIIQLCPDAAAGITDVKSAQDALKAAIEDTERAALDAYGQILFADQNWVETTLNNSATLTNALASYYGKDLTRWKQNAAAKWKVDSALVADLAGLWSKYIGMSTDEVERLYNMYMDYYLEGRIRPGSADYDAFLSIQAYREMLKEIQSAYEDFNPVPSGTSSSKNSSTDAWKAEFEAYYNAHKHAVAMEQETLLDFYLWLDGQDGYKKYFANQEKYLEEYRKYAEEVFDGLKALFDGVDDTIDDHINDVKHQIYLLEQQAGDTGSNDASIVAYYTGLEAYILRTIDQLTAVMRALGYTELEIANSGAIQDLQKQLYDCKSAVEDIIDTLNDDLYNSMKSILDLTIDMIKHEQEDEKEALQNLIDQYSILIDQRKEMLQLAERERQYDENVADKTSEISKLQARIDALSLDDSRAAAIEKAALEEQLAELQKDLAY